MSTMAWEWVGSASTAVVGIVGTAATATTAWLGHRASSRNLELSAARSQTQQLRDERLLAYTELLSADRAALSLAIGKEPPSAAQLSAIAHRIWETAARVDLLAPDEVADGVHRLIDLVESLPSDLRDSNSEESESILSEWYKAYATLILAMRADLARLL